MPLQETTKSVEVAVVFFHERHMATILKDHQLRVRDVRRHELGRLDRADPIMPSDQDQDGVKDARKLILDLNSPISRRVSLPLDSAEFVKLRELSRGFFLSQNLVRRALYLA